MGDQKPRRLLERVPDIIADELIEARQEAQRATGVSGDALLDLLRQFQAGGRGQRLPRGPREGLSPPPGVDLALRDYARALAKVSVLRALGKLDRELRGLRAVRAGGAWAFKVLSEYPEVARYVRAANEGLLKARNKRAEKRAEMAQFNHREWRSIAANLWRADIKPSVPAVAILIRKELARRHPTVPAENLPAIPTIKNKIGGVKAMVKASKRQTGSTIYDAHIRK